MVEAKAMVDTVITIIITNTNTSISILTNTNIIASNTITAEAASNQAPRDTVGLHPGPWIISHKQGKILAHPEHNKPSVLVGPSVPLMIHLRHTLAVDHLGQPGMATGREGDTTTSIKAQDDMRTLQYSISFSPSTGVMFVILMV